MSVLDWLREKFGFDQPAAQATDATDEEGQPEMARTMSQSGIDLLKEFEGVRLDSYFDPAGVLTIGVGHTGSEVFDGQTITMEEAEDLLRADLATREVRLNQLLLGAATTQNQFDAMLSLMFNIGSGNFKGSTVLRQHRAANYAAAANGFLLWNKAHVDGKLVPLKGLTNRRKAERDLYLSG